MVLQDLITQTKKDNKIIMYHIKCIPEPLEPLMVASQKRGLKPDELTAGLTGANTIK